MTPWLVKCVSENSPAGALCSKFLADPGFLLTLEAEQDVTAKFKAARIYLDTAHQQLAYKRISEGCALANIDRQVVDCMTTAAQSWNHPTKSPAENARELTRLVAQQRLHDESDQLQVIETLARLGQHAMAMVSLHTMLAQRGGADEAVEALETAELVDVQGDNERWKTWFAQGMTTRKKLGAMG